MHLSFIQSKMQRKDDVQQILPPISVITDTVKVVPIVAIVEIIYLMRMSEMKKTMMHLHLFQYVSRKFLTFELKLSLYGMGNLWLGRSEHS